MNNSTENHGPKTIILKPEPSGTGTHIVETIRGLPHGAPIVGTRIRTAYGEATCTGIQKSGTGPNETVDVVTLTLNLS